MPAASWPRNCGQSVGPAAEANEIAAAINVSDAAAVLRRIGKVYYPAVRSAYVIT